VLNVLIRILFIVETVDTDTVAVGQLLEKKKPKNAPFKGGRKSE